MSLPRISELVHLLARDAALAVSQRERQLSLDLYLCEADPAREGRLRLWHGYGVSRSHG